VLESPGSATKQNAKEKEEERPRNTRKNAKGEQEGGRRSTDFTDSTDEEKDESRGEATRNQRHTVFSSPRRSLLLPLALSSSVQSVLHMFEILFFCKNGSARAREEVPGNRGKRRLSAK
jgi:hypothetical protein